MRNILGLFLLATLLTSCASTRMMNQQADYSRTLKQLVNSNIDIEDKMDGVAQVFELVLQESMDYGSDRNTLKHLNRFRKRNKSTMNTLYDQVEQEMKKMNAAEQLQFSFSIIRKPYIKSFVSLVPKVEKKIDRKLRQMRMFGRFLKILNPF